MKFRTRRRLSRWILALLTIASIVIATRRFIESLSVDGWNVAELLSVPLFVVLFGWIALSFWTATLGLLAILQTRVRRQPAPQPPRQDPLESPRTAILMPVYNESPLSVFAGVDAMSRSLRDTGRGDEFDIFVLSDTTDPDVWLAEEQVWANLVAESQAAPRIFYRRRSRNTARKSGNIADFCRRWGGLYEYMIVLDADSLMEGATMVEMVRRMDRDHRLGILQAPPAPINRMSLFARLQQFASRVYGPVFLQGFAQWAQFDSNYWGHNAIIRVRPFIEHCSLPLLPGSGPLGGEILSHDFVEAALMARAGWKVGLAEDLGGSYEECPTTLIDFAKRDQRWCQGNLQHIRLVFSEGFRPISRWHLATGIMSYLASPLWLMFILCGAAAIVLDSMRGTVSPIAGQAGLEIFAASMAMLMLPKVWGLLALWKLPQRTHQLGGWSSVISSMLLETVISMLLAPVLMLFHTWFVVNTLRGRSVQWNAQRRTDGETEVLATASVYAVHTVIGVLLAVLIVMTVPSLLPWYLPIIVGLLLSIPLSLAVGSVGLGRWLSSRGLLRIPEEAERPIVATYQSEALERMGKSADSGDPGRLFSRMMTEPALYLLHRGILEATGETASVSPDVVGSVCRALDDQDPAPLTADIKRSVLSDPEAFHSVHVHLRSRLHAASG